MSDHQQPAFIKDDQVVNPYFAPITESARREALRLIAKACPSELPVDLKKICDYELLPLRFIDIQEDNTGARLRQTRGEWFIEVDNDGTGEDDFSQDKTKMRRQRFSVAHELGHYKFESHCDHVLQGALLSGHNPHADNYLRTREAQANDFATELLLPFSELKPLLNSLDFKNDFFQSVDDIANRFESSMTATLKRIASILDIPVVAIHFAPDGRAHQVPSFSREFKSAGFFFPRDGVIPDNSYAATMYDGKTTAQKGRKAYQDCRVWFPGRRKDDYKTVEWTFSLGSYGILVFLELIEIAEY